MFRGIREEAVLSRNKHLNFQISRAFCHKCDADVLIKRFYQSTKENQLVEEFNAAKEIGELYATMKQPASTAKKSTLGIPEVLEVGQDESLGEFIKYKHREMVPLQSISKKVRTVRFAIDLALRLAETLDFAHRSNFCVSNLCPALIFVKTNIPGRLLDVDLFGIMSIAKPPRSFDPLYIAPEIIEEDDKQWVSCPKVDIYSLGIILWEFLVGNHPYQFYPYSLKYWRISIGADAANTHISNIPIIFAKIIQKMTAIDPNDRYQGFNTLISDLKYMLMLMKSKRKWSNVESLNEIDFPLDRVQLNPKELTSSRKLDSVVEQLIKSSESEELIILEGCSEDIQYVCDMISQKVGQQTIVLKSKKRGGGIFPYIDSLLVNLLDRKKFPENVESIDFTSSSAFISLIKHFPSLSRNKKQPSNFPDEGSNLGKALLQFVELWKMKIIICIYNTPGTTIDEETISLVNEIISNNDSRNISFICESSIPITTTKRSIKISIPGFNVGDVFNFLNSKMGSYSGELYQLSKLIIHKAGTNARDIIPILTECIEKNYIQYSGLIWEWDLNLIGNKIKINSCALDRMESLFDKADQELKDSLKMICIMGGRIRLLQPIDVIEEAIELGFLKMASKDEESAEIQFNDPEITNFISTKISVDEKVKLLVYIMKLITAKVVATSNEFTNYLNSNLSSFKTFEEMFNVFDYVWYNYETVGRLGVNFCSIMIPFREILWKSRSNQFQNLLATSCATYCLSPSELDDLNQEFVSQIHGDEENIQYLIFKARYLAINKKLDGLTEHIKICHKHNKIELQSSSQCINNISNILETTSVDMLIESKDQLKLETNRKNIRIVNLLVEMHYILRDWPMLLLIEFQNGFSENSAYYISYILLRIANGELAEFQNTISISWWKELCLKMFPSFRTAGASQFHLETSFAIRSLLWKRPKVELFIDQILENPELHCEDVYSAILATKLLFCDPSNFNRDFKQAFSYILGDLDVRFKPFGNEFLTKYCRILRAFLNDSIDKDVLESAYDCLETATCCPYSSFLHLYIIYAETVIKGNPDKAKLSLLALEKMSQFNDDVDLHYNLAKIWMLMHENGGVSLIIESFEVCVSKICDFGTWMNVFAWESYGAYLADSGFMNLALPTFETAVKEWIKLNAKSRSERITTKYPKLKTPFWKYNNDLQSISFPNEPIDVIDEKTEAHLLEFAKFMSKNTSLDQILKEGLACILEVCAATKATIALHYDNELWVRGVLEMNEDKILLYNEMEVLLENCQEIVPLSALEYVLDSRKTLIENNFQSSNSRIIHDDYFEKNIVKCCCVVPLHHDENIIGFIYLENKTFPAVFTKKRFEVAENVISSLSIAVSNTRLTAMNAKLVQVIEENDELNDSNSDLDEMRFDAPIQRAFSLVEGMLADNTFKSPAEKAKLITLLKILKSKDIYSAVLNNSSKIDSKTKNWLANTFENNPRSVNKRHNSGRSSEVDSRNNLGDRTQESEDTIDKPLTIKERLVKKYFSQCSGPWSFDVFDFKQVVGNTPLFNAAKYLFSKHQKLSHLLPQREVVDYYFKRVEDEYHDLPYHSSAHSADLIVSLDEMIGELTVFNISDIELFCLLVAGAVHDVDHPGVNNNFLMAVNHPLAILYNDSSVLENHHISMAFSIATEEGCNLFSRIDQSKFPGARKLMIQLVMATDLSHHFNIISKFKSKLTTGERDLADSDTRQLILQMMIKMGDINSACKPFELCKNWAQRVMDEFFYQGDLERRLGLPISTFMDRYDTDIARCQIGFLDFLVTPLFTAWSAAFPSQYSTTALENISANRENWKNQLDGIASHFTVADFTQHRPNNQISMCYPEIKLGPDMRAPTYIWKVPSKKNSESLENLEITKTPFNVSSFKFRNPVMLTSGFSKSSINLNSSQRLLGSSKLFVSEQKLYTSPALKSKNMYTEEQDLSNNDLDTPLKPLKTTNSVESMKSLGRESSVKSQTSISSSESPQSNSLPSENRSSLVVPSRRGSITKKGSFRDKGVTADYFTKPRENSAPKPAEVSNYILKRGRSYTVTRESNLGLTPLVITMPLQSESDSGPKTAVP